MTAQKYRKLPVEIEAWQFTDPSEGSLIAEWCGGTNENSPEAIEIATLEGTMRADLGDYIIRGVQGEFYPCKPEIFAATYEPASVAEERALDSIETANPGIDREEVRAQRAGR